MNESNLKNKLMEFAPLIGLIIVVGVFAILSKGKTLSAMNLKIVTGQAMVTALIAIGAVFIFATKAIDMSLSGTICLSAITASILGMQTGSMTVVVIAAFVSSMVISIVKGLAAAYLTLPVFIVTIIFGNFLSAIALVLMGKQTTIMLGSIVKITDATYISIALLAVFYIVAVFLFSFTKIGKSNKLVGGNPVASDQSGISSKRSIIVAFLISGIGVTLATLVTILRTKTVTMSTGSGIGQDILVAVVLGGMPLSGGPRSKISAGLIGAFTITFLNNGLSIIGVSNDIIQIIRGIVFLGVVFITSMGYRTKLLPR